MKVLIINLKIRSVSICQITHIKIKIYSYLSILNLMGTMKEKVTCSIHNKPSENNLMQRG